MKTYFYRASNLKSTITFLASVSQWKSISGDRQKPSILAIYQRVSLCRVGMHCSTHRYKLPVNFSANPTSGGSL